MSKPKIRITLVDRLGSCGCHRGHKIGDSFGYDTDRGELLKIGPCVKSSTEIPQFLYRIVAEFA